MSIEVILDNLNRIKKICNRYSLVVPDKLGLEIFDHVFKPDRPLREDQLEIFTCPFLKLTTITLKERKFSSLKSFYFLKYHPIKSLSIIDFKTINNLPVMPLIEDIEFINCRLQYEEFKHLGRILSCSRHLKSIKFVNINRMGNSFTYTLQDLKVHSENLTTIVLSYCFLTEQQGILLGNFLKYCRGLREFDISGNIGLDKGFRAICSGLKSCSKNLSIVSFNNCRLLNIKLVWLVNFLKSCSSLKGIDLGRNQLTESVQEICKATIPSSVTLVDVDFSFCALSLNEKTWVKNFFHNSNINVFMNDNPLYHTFHSFY